jgi:hypothetical protein
MTPKRFKYYPEEYSELFRRAHVAPLRIPFSTPEQAKQLRSHLYAFRTSIRDARDSELIPEDLTILAHTLTMTIVDSVLIVHKPKRTSNLQKALAAALEG